MDHKTLDTVISFSFYYLLRDLCRPSSTLILFSLEYHIPSITGRHIKYERDKYMIHTRYLPALKCNMKGLGMKWLAKISDGSLKQILLDSWDIIHSNLYREKWDIIWYYLIPENLENLEIYFPFIFFSFIITMDSYLSYQSCICRKRDK